MCVSPSRVFRKTFFSTTLIYIANPGSQTRFSPTPRTPRLGHTCLTRFSGVESALFFLVVFHRMYVCLLVTHQCAVHEKLIRPFSRRKTTRLEKEAFHLNVVVARVMPRGISSRLPWSTTSATSIAGNIDSATPVPACLSPLLPQLVVSGIISQFRPCRSTFLAAAISTCLPPTDAYPTNT